ncbi:hypothetical protein D3C87_1340710 [compost metagenome]
MGDGGREAEQPGADGTQVNRVVVAGHFGVLPANVRRRLPAGHLHQLQRRGQHFLDRLAIQFHTPAQHLAFSLPQHAQLIVEGGHQVERRTLGMGLQVLHLYADPRAIDPAHWPQDANAVAQVDQPQQWERKRLGREQLHLQGKRQDVRIGGWQQAVVGKAADLAIGRQALRIDIDPAAQA